MTVTAEMLAEKNVSPCEDPDPTNLRTRVVAQAPQNALASKDHVHDCSEPPTTEPTPEPWEVFEPCSERPIC
jgi:hypothetical protein